MWTIVPTAPAIDGPAQLELNINITRQADQLLKYFLTVRNLGPNNVSFEARYEVLGWDRSFT